MPEAAAGFARGLELLTYFTAAMALPGRETLSINQSSREYSSLRSQMGCTSSCTSAWPAVYLQVSNKNLVGLAFACLVSVLCVCLQAWKISANLPPLGRLDFVMSRQISAVPDLCQIVPDLCQIYAALWPVCRLSQLEEYLIPLSVQLRRDSKPYLTIYGSWDALSKHRHVCTLQEIVTVALPSVLHSFWKTMNWNAHLHLAIVEQGSPMLRCSSWELAGSCHWDGWQACNPHF